MDIFECEKIMLITNFNTIIRCVYLLSNIKSPNPKQLYINILK